MLPTITRITRVLAIVAVSLGFAALAHAQAINTAPLSGIVRTENGLAISGAKVKITHEPTTGITTVVSNEAGAFVSRGLRPGGPYTVEIDAAGYGPTQLKDIYLDIEAGANVNVVLLASDVVQMEKFSVTASANDHLFDPMTTDRGTFLNNRDIVTTVIGDRSINSLAARDSRISYNSDPMDKAISVSGINNRYNAMQVDGVSVSDPFGLNSNNTAAERNVIPLDSLEAIVISTAPYDVRKGGFTGASINAITKSGGNDFHGSVYYTFRNQEFVGEHLDGKAYPISNFKEQTFGATLGGPIIPRKLFFFLSYEKVDEDRIPPTVINKISDADMEKIVQGAEHLGFNLGSSTPPSGNKLKDNTILAKIDWQINESHRLTTQYKYTDSERPTYPGFGTTGGASENNFSFSNSWYSKNVSNKSVSAQLVSRWTDKLNTEIAFSYSNYHSEPKYDVQQPYVTIQRVPTVGSSNTSYVSFGTDYSYQANVLDTKSYTAEMAATYALTSKHTLHAGVQYQFVDVYNLYVQNAYGSYTFYNLAEFDAIANPASGINDGTKNYYSYYYNRIVPGINPAAEFGEATAGIFIRDEWRVAPRFNVDMGLRLDTAIIGDDVPFNQSFFNAFGVRNDYTYDGKAILQPRIGFNWQPKINDGRLRTTVRGGAGLFAGTMPRVWMSNSFSNTGMNYESYTAGTSPGGAAPKVVADPNGQIYDPAKVSKVQTVAFMQPGFRLPSRWKANIAIEREIGPWGIVASAEYEWSKVNDDVRFVNINLAQSTVSVGGVDTPVIGPDGRVMYWRSFNASTGLGSGTKVKSADFTNRIIGVTNSNKGKSNVFTAMLNRPAKKDGWSWSAAYTYTQTTQATYGTSSVATSNWNYRATLNPNEEHEHTSDLEIRHRIVANVTKDFNWLSIGRTSFTLNYNGHSGLPFSMVASNDVNGDARSTNDLVYIPYRDGREAQYTFSSAAEKEKFYKIVDRFGLREGSVSDTNSLRYPWVNQFNFRVEQEVKLPLWRHALTLAVDVLNIGNLLNDKWGVILGSNQFYLKTESIAKVDYNQNAKTYSYSSVSNNLANNSFNPSVGRGEPAASRWSILFSAKYKF